MIYVCSIFITFVIGIIILIGILSNDELVTRILVTIGMAGISFFVINGLHYLNGDSIKDKDKKEKEPYAVTIEKEEVTEAYQVTSHSIDGDTVKLVLESGNVEYYVLKKGESVKCQY